MKIPKSFYLYGLKINVVFDNSLNKKCMGYACYDTNTIKIATDIKSRDLLEQTFLHEVLHFILLHSKVINKYKLESGKNLHSDEDFIDNVASLLHQSFISSSGTLSKSNKKKKKL
jgi:hypothetical protein